MSAPAQSGLLSRLKRAGGLDFHILLTLLFRGWGIVAGGATLLLLPLWLDPVQQGYYYTFASLLALQIFFELGLNGIIVQLVSHEAAALEFQPGCPIAGDEGRIQRLGALVRLIRIWYCAGAWLFAAAAGAAGWVFFSRQGGLSASAWGPVWSVLVLATAANLYVSPQLAVLEGLGRVGQVARLRLVQAMLGYIALWLLLALGAGLWAAAAVPVAAVAGSIVWLRSGAEPLRAALRQSDARVGAVSWRRDILPLQWRTAASWASGYLCYNLFTPVVFSQNGAAEAGRLGLALAIFSSVTTLGLSWISAKNPAFTMHIARGESHELNTLFREVTVRSTVFTACVSFLLVALGFLAAQAGIGAMERVSTPWTLFWLACSSVLSVLIYACACYMRAHREEPLVLMSVVSAVCTIAAVLLTAGADVSRMMALNAGIGCFISLPWAFMVLRRYQARHRAV